MVNTLQIFAYALLAAAYAMQCFHVNQGVIAIMLAVGYFAFSAIYLVGIIGRIWFG
jgi:hypothetical protein